ncbi:hypothetical protein GCM10008904_13720 [Paraclostridium ghonii]|uniref:Ribosomal RNA small subunit methyltransferase F N-terminal domain-containing protein n=1 Tax=Paraclostridium ghonii TaxID=29358 RepID=A0ABU0N2Z2_9FIRM|nr:hypothetical protein [Paeniclostridium ghonii]MDQ0557536.1 hypothetical protein [Paeniclostridium ghonii]
MKEILKGKYDDFIKSYEESKTTVLRVNNLKMSKEELVKRNLFKLSQIPWADERFYLEHIIFNSHKL